MYETKSRFHLLPFFPFLYLNFIFYLQLNAVQFLVSLQFYVNITLNQAFIMFYFKLFPVIYNPYKTWFLQTLGLPFYVLKVHKLQLCTVTSTCTTKNAKFHHTNDHCSRGCEARKYPLEVLLFIFLSFGLTCFGDEMFCKPVLYVILVMKQSWFV